MSGKLLFRTENGLELAAAIEHSVEEATVVQNEPDKQYEGEKKPSFDIHAKLTSGEFVDVEMQSVRKNYDYGNRAEYQAARLMTT